MKRLAISIPTPCHEKFESFAPTAKGGYCTSCRKEIIDFTTWTDERLIAYFMKGGMGCGRFRADQLTGIGLEPGRNTSHWWIGAFFFVLVTMFSKPALAQTGKKADVTEQMAIDSASRLNDLKAYSEGRSQPTFSKPRLDPSVEHQLQGRLGGVVAVVEVGERRGLMMSIIDFLYYR